MHETILIFLIGLWVHSPSLTVFKVLSGRTKMVGEFSLLGFWFKLYSRHCLDVKFNSV